MEDNTGKETSVKKRSPRKKHDSAATAPGFHIEAEAIPVSDFQVHTKQVLSEQFANIIATMVQKSAAGSISHTKYLFEISGVKEELQRQRQDSDEPTLADLILAEVRRCQNSQASSAAELEARDKVEARDDSNADPVGNAMQPIRTAE